MNFTNAAGHTVIARFRRSSDPLIADATSRFDLRIGGAPVITQPFANHNGGHLAFGPDGYLYIGLGDGGSGDDPDHRAQNPRELLGKMLRIDVNVPDTDAAGYRVPPDNPFLGSGPSGTRPEIWSFGLRNPWRYSFDDPARGGTGALVIGDVGQNRWEEIDYEPARPRRAQLRLAQSRGAAQQRDEPPTRVSAARRSHLRVRPRNRRVGDGRIRLSGRRARRRVSRPVRVRRFRRGTDLVACPVDRAQRRRPGLGSSRPHRWSLAPQVPSARSASTQRASSTLWRIQAARCCGCSAVRRRPRSRPAYGLSGPDLLE